MSRKVLGTAVAAVFATAMASAQTTGQQDQQASGQQMVTIEGCLQQQPGTTAATMDDATFVLQNAQVRSGSEAVGTAGETAGTAGTQQDTQAQAGRDRAVDTAVGTSGEAGVGTAGAAAHGMASYKVKGLEDEKLTEHVGQRVQVQGYVETRGEGYGADRDDADRRDADRTDRDRTDADRPAGQAPTAGAATEPAGTTGTGVAGHGTAGTPAPGAAGQHDQHGQIAGATAAGAMKTFRATSIQRISGECPPAAAR